MGQEPTWKEKYKQATEYAKNIDVAMGYQQFTLNDLVKNSSMGHEEARTSLAFLMDFGILQVLPEEGKDVFKIDLNRTSMTEQLNNLIETAVGHIKEYNRAINDYETAKSVIEGERAREEAIAKELAGRSKKDATENRKDN